MGILRNTNAAMKSATAAELMIINPDGRSRQVALGDAAVILGRDPACDIPLEDLSASRRHVRIRYEGDRHILEDLGSKNGTLLNSEPVRRAPLVHGDEILIGAVRAVYHQGDQAFDEAPMTASVVLSEQAPRRESTTYRGVRDALQLSHRRLQILYELNERLTVLRDRTELLEEAMNVCFEMLRFERGAIAIRQSDGRSVDWPVVRNLRGAEGELTVSRTILSSALTHGERVIVNDTDTSEIDPTISMVQLGIRSAMCVPLMSEEENLGVIYGDRTSTGTTYSQEDIDFLAAIGRLVTIGLINARLLDEQKDKVRLENEIGLARGIQTGLLPQYLPDRDDMRVAALNEPGDHVSGDYYDVMELKDGRLAFLIADVTGEGVAASLLMAHLQAAVRVTLPENPEPGVLLGKWNDLILNNTDASRFVTCLLGMIDPENRTMRLSSAGHHMPILVRPGKALEPVVLEPGFPLGVIEDTTYDTAEIDLGPGDVTIMTYTDGVIEAMNNQKELFGMPRLEAVLREHADANPAAMVKQIRQTVRQHAGGCPQSDDITILVLNLPAAEATQ